MGSDNDSGDPPETSEGNEEFAAGELEEATDHAFMSLISALGTARLAEQEAKEFRRAEDRETGKAKSGARRRRQRREFLEALDETIDRGTLAAVAHVMFGDAESEAKGIAAMVRVAPMVVELQAVRPRVYRLVKLE